MFPLLGSQVSDKNRKINIAIDEFLLALRRGKVYGSYDISTKTASILLMVIESSEWQNAKSLIELIKAYGKRLTEAKPLELSIVNTIRRVLYIVRDEHKREQASSEEVGSGTGSGSGDYGMKGMVGMGGVGAPVSPAKPSSSSTSSASLNSSSSQQFADRIALMGSAGGVGSLKRSHDGPGGSGVSGGAGDRASLRSSTAFGLNESGMLKMLAPSGDLSHSSKNLREAIVVTIHEFLAELKEVGNAIATSSLEHLHAKEIVMTYGKSRTVEQFLKFAAQKRTFEVVVVESSPEDQGQEMANSLASAGIETCLIPDSAVFAIMARVNKVIVGTHAVMANGGLISVSGTHMIATAAKHFNVPFVVCTGLYKLSPLYAHDQDSFNELKSPSEVLHFSEAQRLAVSVKNPAWDYTPPELVSLYITNSGSYSPTYIYRLLAEYYHPEDMDLESMTSY